MRLVQVTVPAGKREAVLRALDENDVDYVVTDETSSREYTGVVYFPLPTGAVEDVLDSLRDVGLENDAYTVVLDAETVVSRKFEQLAERYEQTGQDEDRIARAELRERARELTPKLPTFIVMTVVSGVIATAGLLLDSPAVVVGSMVIAPLIGPAMDVGVGSVIDDRDLFRTGLRLQVFGVVLAVASAAVFALFVKEFHLVPPGMDILAVGEIAERVSPGFLSLGVALGAGAAGAMSLRSGVSTPLVGVMIAAALVPPVGVVGIGIAWGMPAVVLGSTVLVLVNFLSINLAALVTLWYSGYRPESWVQHDYAKSATLKRGATLAVAILVLSAFLGGVTYVSFQTASFEQTSNDEVTDLFRGGQYDELRLLELHVNYSGTLFFREPGRVAVTVGRPAGDEYPQLAGDIRDRLRAATGRNVTVQVRFVELDRAP